MHLHKNVRKESKPLKSTGIVRRVDELGRIVIPIELRRILNIREKDLMEVFVNEDQIILKKYETQMTCQVTGETSEDNISLADGNIVINPDVAEALLNELQSKVNQ